MNETMIIELKKVNLKDPILIEGLPGIGLIGKLAAEHLISEIKAEKFAELYSPYFFHQALIEADSTVRLMRNEFYHGKARDKDLIILVGDLQPAGNETYGHYEIVAKILNYVEKFGVKEIYTLGGSSTGGAMVKKPRVFGSATDIELVERYENLNIVFKSEPGAAIVGASGLLLACGKLRGMRGICLLGESPGLWVDAKAAKSVLAVLCQILGIEIDLSELERRAQETEEFIKKVQEMEKKKPKEAQRMGEDYYYIR